MPRDIADVVRLFAFARSSGTPLVFRAGGTSLNGQTQTESVLVDARRHWRRVRLLEGGTAARVQPGVVLGHVNRLLARHGRKLGPDPASSDIACVGGVIANNSGGMRCGTVADSYRTVRALTFVLPSGAVIDTADPDAEPQVRPRRPRARRRPGADPGRAPGRLRAGRPRRAEVRDQEHHRLSPMRVPRRRLAAGDLPAADRRLGGNAGVRGRGRIRDCAVRAPRLRVAVVLPRHRRRRSGRRAAGRCRRHRDRADGGADPDRGRVQHAGHARALANAAADRGGAAGGVPSRGGERTGRFGAGRARDPGRPGAGRPAQVLA